MAVGRARDGETWLRDCTAPFSGRPATTKPALASHFRETELDVARNAGAQPKSIFQIGGAGAVGTGSIRGMPHLLRLRDGGCSIWPFDPPVFPVVVEIYPRVLTGPVVKSNKEARVNYVANRFPNLPSEMAACVASTEDAFDTAVSALAMAQHSAELSALPTLRDPISLLEGRIWIPRAH